MEKFDQLMMIFFGGLAVAGVVLPIPIGLAFRGFIWLRDGVWMQITFSSLGIPRPKVDWVGIQKIVDFYYTSPADVVVAVSVFVVALIMSRILDDD